MQTINLRRPNDTTLSSSAQTLAAELPIIDLVAIANAHPGQHLDAARFTHLLASRHTCERCGKRLAAGRVNLAWLCQACMEVTQ